MIVYVTKYALTQGIIEAEVDRQYTDGSIYVWVKWPGGISQRAMFRREDAPESLDAARKRVAQMVAAKRKTLARVAAKLDRIERDGVKVKRLDGAK